MPKITLNLGDTILLALKLKSWEERKGEDTYSYEEFLGLLNKEQVI